MNNFYGRRISISPAEVNFSQDSVAMCFQNDTEINKSLEEIAKGHLSVSSFPLIRVLVIDGGCYSVDNRRLYVFRVLNLLGLLQSIQVKEVDSFERELTTQNEGCHVWLRNRKDNNGRWLEVDTYRHCSCNRGRNARLPDWWNSNLNCHVSLVNVRIIRPSFHSSRFVSPASSIRAQQANRQSSIKSVSQQVANASRANKEYAKSTSSRASVDFSRHYVGEFDDFAEAKPNLHQLYQFQKSLVVKPNTMVDKVTNKQFSNRPAVYQASQSRYATRSTEYALDFDQEFQQSTSQTPSHFVSQSVIDHFDYPMHMKPESRSHTVPDRMVITAPRSESSPWNHTFPERSNKRQTEEDCDSISEANCFIDLLKTIFCCVPCKSC